MELTYGEAVVSEGLVGWGGRCSEDIFVCGDKADNKIVVRDRQRI
jgi:hypothetical protein